MRQPSRSSIILMIAAPVIGCLLLWYVVFPMIERDGGLQDLLAWKSSREIDFAEDGFMPGEGNVGGGGFEDIQSGPETASSTSPGTSSGSANTTTSGGEESTTVYERGNTGQDATNTHSNATARLKSNTGGPTAGNGGTTEEITEPGKTDVERVGSAINATLQVKQTGEQVKEMVKGKTKSMDQNKTNGGGGGLLLLPPDDPDPLDVPLDGGLTVLVAAAVGYGVRKTGLLSRKKTTGGTPVV